MAKRAQFDFNNRVQLAKTYMEDGAYLSAARVLDLLAGEMRQAGEARNDALAKASGGQAPDPKPREWPISQES